MLSLRRGRKNEPPINLKNSGKKDGRSSGGTGSSRPAASQRSKSRRPSLKRVFQHGPWEQHHLAKLGKGRRAGVAMPGLSSFWEKLRSLPRPDRSQKEGGKSKPSNVTSGVIPGKGRIEGEWGGVGPEDIEKRDAEKALDAKACQIRKRHLRWGWQKG